MTKFYTTLADWWPVISPVEDYAEEAGELRQLIVAHHPNARSLLEMDSGGGHVAFHLRTLALGRSFDVVLTHDAIDHMTTEADLTQVLSTGWRHLTPGGLVVLLPDTVAESYEPGTDVSGGDSPACFQRRRG